ncbi:MAG: YggS family pyridoxal phosphate-dependent enzyme [Fermentimonas sp.]|jgi:pyridoxal phosphate enzyme (YggS family)|nr:YggS family pyridoxal phosphate-dependent enzyme [Fermentimonas sp.]MDD4283552.1 YggS family pyridoxal phosphate-dependent enzyme [Fermentimonas sp.]HBT85304.1 YggS family pyridoxal phosphate-dependent enzyme [Porphyromonadaceae bacterium]
MSIKSKIENLKGIIPSDVKMVAVSKFHSNSEIMEAYDTGHRMFGESRVQELVQKYQELPKDIEWHFIGNLQRNKVKQIAPFVSLIHSLDSERLMLEIEKQGSVNDRVIPCLLQVHIAEEETKSGFSPEECRRFVADAKWKECSHIKISGLMGMATFTEDESKVKKEFDQLRTLFGELKDIHFKNDPDFKEISMGMTGDFQLAINSGSTIVRIGTLIFGSR